MSHGVGGIESEVSALGELVPFGDRGGLVHGFSCPVSRSHRQPWGPLHLLTACSAVSVPNFPIFSPARTPVIGVRATSQSGMSPFTKLHLTAPAKTLLPNRVTPTGVREGTDTSFRETLFTPPHDCLTTQPTLSRAVLPRVRHFVLVFDDILSRLVAHCSTRRSFVKPFVLKEQALDIISSVPGPLTV